MHFGACAAAKACREKNKKADNFPAGEYVFHIFLVPDVGNLFSAMSGLGALFLLGQFHIFSLDYTFSCTLDIMLIAPIWDDLPKERACCLRRSVYPWMLPGTKSFPVSVKKMTQWIGCLVVC